MILITGATGQLGTATIEHLLKNTPADKVAAFARDEDKAKSLKEKNVEVRIGNYDDIDALDRAMQGIEKVLLISGEDPNRLQQHKNVIDAAKRAGVKHIGYTTVSLNDLSTSAIKDFMESHFLTEEYIQNSGMAYTLLRNTLYADVIPMFVGENVFESGVILPAGSGKVPYALRREMGEAAANVMLQDGHENQSYRITANELYSFEDVANVLSELTEKNIKYTDADASAFADTLRSLGVPDEVIFIVTGFSADIKNHQYEIISNDLEKLLGRKPASLRESLKEIYGL